MEETDAFYVVRKGDTIGVYKHLSDCQDQAGSSVCNPSMSVYKGFGLPKETEEYLASKGLKNATYSISANDVRADLFGKFVACPVQEPESFKRKSTDMDSPQKRLQEPELIPNDGIVLPQRKHLKSKKFIEVQPVFSTCIIMHSNALKLHTLLEKHYYDNLLRTPVFLSSMVLQNQILDSLVQERSCVLKMIVWCTDCEKVRALELIMPLNIEIEGLRKTKNQNMADLCQKARALKDKFVSFETYHLCREENSEADDQAYLAINLKDGEVHEECEFKESQMFGTRCHT